MKELFYLILTTSTIIVPIIINIWVCRIFYKTSNIQDLYLSIYNYNMNMVFSNKLDRIIEIRRNKIPKILYIFKNETYIRRMIISDTDCRLLYDFIESKHYGSMVEETIYITLSDDGGYKIIEPKHLSFNMFDKVTSLKDISLTHYYTLMKGTGLE